MKSLWSSFESLLFDTVFSWPLIMDVSRKHRIVPYKIEGWVFLKILFYFKITKNEEIKLRQSF